MLGNWTTYDCPYVPDDETKQEAVIQEAEKWLNEKLDKCEAKARIKDNPHELGNYRSFEIDCYNEAMAHDDYDCDDMDCEKCLAKYKLYDDLNEIEREYSKKYNEYL